jgi:hypothetical protein
MRSLSGRPRMEDARVTSYPRECRTGAVEERDSGHGVTK